MSGNPDESDTTAAVGPASSDAPGSAGDTRALPGAPLLAGEELAGRFRVVRFLARGGMGEVYEAEDRELDDRVALKTVRPELAADRTAMDRFRREIQLARKVTHPNVCRTFDIGHHGEVTFVTMEYLAGETLAARLQRTGGRMSTQAARPLVEQMARGLQAAHEAGIVHRDFKSANVVLVPGPAGERAVITDFGLARGLSGMAEPLSGTGMILGTPDYMAPEQVRGAALSPATDVYALGIVMYEMVAGRRPFVGDSPISTAVQRLTVPPRPPHELAPDLDPAWEAVILRCLAVDPGARPQSGLAVLAALDGQPTPAAPLPAARPASRTSVLVGGLALALLAVGGAILASRQAPAPPAAPPAAAAAAAAKPRLRPAVAVLGFKNLSGREDARWLAGALPEMLAAEMGATELVRTVANADVQRVREELELGDAESVPRAGLARLREALGADFVVAGSYLAVPAARGMQIRLDARVQASSTAEVKANVSETAPDSEILALITRAGGRLRAAFGERAGESGKSSLPGNPEAMRLYSEGMARLAAFDNGGARGLLEQAAIADPRSAMVHSALARVYWYRDETEKAVATARRALDLSEGLSREQRLLAEARYWEAMEVPEKASERYRTLFGFFPDNLDYGLDLAYALNQLRLLDEAARVVAALRALPPPAGTDLRVDWMEARLEGNAGDHRAMQALAAQAAQKATARGSRLEFARSRILEARAWRGLKDPARAAALAEEARTVFAEAGHSDLWRAMVEVALARQAEGKLEEAEVLCRRAVELGRAQERPVVIAGALRALADLQLARSDFAGARDSLEGALAQAKRVGAARTQVSVLLQFANEVFIPQKDAAAARRAAQEALALAGSAGLDGHRARAQQVLDSLK